MWLSYSALVSRIEGESKHLPEPKPGDYFIVFCTSEVALNGEQPYGPGVRPMSSRACQEASRWCREAQLDGRFGSINDSECEWDTFAKVTGLSSKQIGKAYRHLRKASRDQSMEFGRTIAGDILHHLGWEVLY